MVKVLVAEDEMPLLRGIKVMIEQGHAEFSVVKCARNGREALEYLKDNPVDVIFTDINMPISDGIELMKYAYENCPEATKVAISGYNDFHYAQQAIQYQVKRYLLKPIVKEELESLLEEIYREHKSRYQKKQRENLVDAIYTGKKTKNEDQVLVLYMCAGPFIEWGMEECITECNFWNMDNEEIEEAAHRLLPAEALIYVFEKNQPNERIMLIVSKEEVNIEAFGGRFVQEMEKRGVKATLCCGQDKTDMAGIPQICRNLRDVLKAGILFGEGSLILWEGGEAKTEGDVRTEEVLDLIESGLRSGKPQISMKVAERYYENKKIKQQECEKILLKWMEKLEQTGETGELGREEKEEIIKNLLLYSTEMGQLLMNLRAMFGTDAAEKREYRTEDMMQKVEIYIKEHMTEPITAGELAAEFGLVAPYLSRLFKEYIGHTPAQYIQKLRIERAKYLLLIDEEILAKDVGEMVGYPDSAYFSKLFKKKVGLYPSEFKEKNRRAEKKEE